MVSLSQKFRDVSYLELNKSRQVTTILIRYGHTIGYNMAEELETEMTYTSIQDNKIPKGITAANGHSNHGAFDNFDRFVDITSRKYTMHDIDGIIYQFSSNGADNFGDGEATTLSASQVNDNDNGEGPTRKRRHGVMCVCVNEISREVRPNYSKPKANMQLITVDSFTNTTELCKSATEIATDKDLLWIKSLSRIDSVPMWLGYNCMRSSDHSEKQKIEYLLPAVVNDTLNMAKEIVKKCQQPEIIVKYDLAVAKMTMQIQEQEKPLYNEKFR